MSFFFVFFWCKLLLVTVIIFDGSVFWANLELFRVRTKGLSGGKASRIKQVQERYQINCFSPSSLKKQSRRKTKRN